MEKRSSMHPHKPHATMVASHRGSHTRPDSAQTRHTTSIATDSVRICSYERVKGRSHTASRYLYLTVACTVPRSCLSIPDIDHSVLPDGQCSMASRGISVVNVRRVLHLYTNARLRCAGSQQLQFRARICCPPARSSQRSNTDGHALKRPRQHGGLPLSCSNRGRRHGKCCSLLCKAASGAASPVPKE